MDQMLQELGPFVLRPIFTFAAAAGMERKLVDGGGVILLRQKRYGGLVVEGQARDGVRVKNRQPFERFEKGLGGVDFGPYVGTVRSRDELCGGASADVGLKDAVGIIQVGHNQIELGE